MARRVIPEPYAYPTTPHMRSHGPEGWAEYGRYRDWLRDEFSFRCVYCLEREVWRDMRAPMHIDHWIPQAIRKDLRGEYSNLLYACPACNSQKSDQLLPDPCEVALGACLRVHKDGRIEALNEEGAAIIEILALDEPKARERRRLISGTVQSLAETNWPLFIAWMCYPKDLPDLTQTPPPRNTKPDSIAQSFYAKKFRGELPEVY